MENLIRLIKNEFQKNEKIVSEEYNYELKKAKTRYLECKHYLRPCSETIEPLIFQNFEELKDFNKMNETQQMDFVREQLYNRIWILKNEELPEIHYRYMITGFHIKRKLFKRIQIIRPFSQEIYTRRKIYDFGDISNIQRRMQEKDKINSYKEKYIVTDYKLF